MDYDDSSSDEDANEEIDDLEDEIQATERQKRKRNTAVPEEDEGRSAVLQQFRQQRREEGNKCNCRGLCKNPLRCLCQLAKMKCNPRCSCVKHGQCGNQV